jgi:D-glycerate 3-kinase
LDDWLPGFMAERRLPEAFRLTFDEVCRPFADRGQDWRDDFGRTAFVGLCGAPGIGKSTVTEATVRLLAERGLTAAVIDLDDFSLGHEARGRLAERVHRLMKTRGLPGAHDMALASQTLDQLRGSSEMALPRFDSSADEPAARSTWPRVEGPVDVVILKGWFVGARPEPAERLPAPLNGLERRDDPARAWRGYVNRQLGEAYQGLFARLDRLVLLQAPSFDAVCNWRARGMSSAEARRQLQPYERLTRWILDEMPARADWAVRLRSDRTPIPLTT